MSQVIIYTDEDVNSIVVNSLRIRGYKVFSTVECKNCGNTDEQQLDYARSIKAALLTCNVRDYARLHYEFSKIRKPHHGIIVTSQLNPKIIVNRLLKLINKLSAEDMLNRLEYLSNWG